MVKRLVLDHTSQQNITDVLETLRKAGVKAPAGGMVGSAATILVEDADVPRAVHLLVAVGIEVQTA